MKQVQQPQHITSSSISPRSSSLSAGRYAVGALVMLAGFAALITVPGDMEFGLASVIAFSSSLGAALFLLLLNILYRLSVRLIASGGGRRRRDGTPASISSGATTTRRSMNTPVGGSFPGAVWADDRPAHRSRGARVRGVGRTSC